MKKKSQKIMIHVNVEHYIIPWSKKQGRRWGMRPPSPDVEMVDVPLVRLGLDFLYPGCQKYMYVSGVLISDLFHPTLVVSNLIINFIHYIFPKYIS